MMNCYYAVRMYIDKYPLEINCQELLDIADKISNLFEINYDRLGYTLLHPDYDYKDLGAMRKNTNKNREKFKELTIPMLYYGKEKEDSASPFINFSSDLKDNMILPYFDIEFQYPIKESQYLQISVDIKEELMSRELTLTDFLEVYDIVNDKGFNINSAYVDYHFGNARRINLGGGECGITTINDWRIIAHSIYFMQDWKDKIMDVFYLNAFNKDIISEKALAEIKKIVGDKNIIEHKSKIIFKLPLAKNLYLTSRIMPIKSRMWIKRILESENVCQRDASFLASVFRL